MNFKESLLDFKKKVDREIEIYFDKAIKETKKRDRVVTDALKYVKELILVGGKRIRPALMYYGYIGAGGKEKEKIIKTSASIELIHMFLLIHDDIIDRDFERHGKETVNRKYEKIGKKYFPKKDSHHFGNSVALIIGDMIAALGNQIIFNSDFKDNLIIKSLFNLQSIVSYTVIGQVKDLYIEYLGRATEKDVLSMYEYKTAKYTIEGPLHLGATLGGAEKNFMDKLSAYAVPVGIAFQIQDDILGIFGNEEKLGKKVGSDIEEGKITLLVVKAREKANREQRKILNNILGKENLTDSEIKTFRKIIEDTGALEYSRNMAVEYVKKGKAELKKLNAIKEMKDFLEGMADYIIKREL